VRDCQTEEQPNNSKTQRHDFDLMQQRNGLTVDGR
jgi:hypothetical protein